MSTKPQGGEIEGRRLWKEENKGLKGVKEIAIYAS